MTGAGKEDVFRKAGDFVGAPADLAVRVGASWPIWKPEDELTERGLGKPGDIANGELAKAYFNTGAWLKTVGEFDTAPTMDEIVAHIDTLCAEKALEQGSKARPVFVLQQRLEIDEGLQGTEALGDRPGLKQGRRHWLAQVRRAAQESAFQRRRYPGHPT